MELFSKDDGAKEIISQMAAGAEKAVMNIPNGGRNKTGFADSQYRRVIIEFEKTIIGKSKLELKKTENEIHHLYKPFQQRRKVRYRLC